MNKKHFLEHHDLSGYKKTAVVEVKEFENRLVHLLSNLELSMRVIENAIQVGNGVLSARKRGSFC